jgi:succinoglycan biosynthesis protein ExoM
MLIKKTSIDICVATYKRPHGLSQLLKSLSEQTVINALKLRIIIIDNDPEKSAKKIVGTFFSDKDMAYIYDVQPEKNISLTRNMALDYASADYLVFIDDDEWANDDWLNALLLASQKYEADVIFGPVIPQLPKDAPSWIRKVGYFYHGAGKTGDMRQHGGTGNTLVRNSVQIKPLLHFDLEYGLTGGEDTELFHRLYNAGFKLVWCNEAIAYETIPYERMTINWLAKRALRGGQIYARIFHKNQPLYKVIIQFIKRSGYLFFACALFPFALITGKARWVWVLRKIMSNAGQLSMLLANTSYQEYK